MEYLIKILSYLKQWCFKLFIFSFHPILVSSFHRSCVLSNIPISLFIRKSWWDLSKVEFEGNVLPRDQITLWRDKDGMAKCTEVYSC